MNRTLECKNIPPVMGETYLTKENCSPVRKNTSSEGKEVGKGMDWQLQNSLSQGSMKS